MPVRTNLIRLRQLHQLLASKFRKNNVSIILLCLKL